VWSSPYTVCRYGWRLKKSRYNLGRPSSKRREGNPSKGGRGDDSNGAGVRSKVGLETRSKDETSEYMQGVLGESQTKEKGIGKRAYHVGETRTKEGESLKGSSNASSKRGLLEHYLQRKYKGGSRKK